MKFYWGCRAFETPSISGQELRDLIVEKWGRSYDTRLHKRGRRQAIAEQCLIMFVWQLPALLCHLLENLDSSVRLSCSLTTCACVGTSASKSTQVVLLTLTCMAFCRMYLQIMWKFLEQRSFHMNENEYQAQLDAVAEYLTLWRVGPTVRAAIRSAPPRGPGYTGGGGARAVRAPFWPLII